MKSIVDRILEKVEMIPEAGCWIFTGTVKRDRPYGRISVPGAPSNKSHTKLVHRVMYEQIFGLIPDSLFVCHVCDVPSCCNPAHLFLGEHKDNMADMARKGRRQGLLRGAANGRSKLTLVDVQDIRRRRERGETLTQLANVFGVAHSSIGRILRGEAWK